MSLYDLALFVHIVGVLGMFMAVAVELMGMLSMRRVRTTQQLSTLLGAEAVLEKVFPAVTVLLLVAGIYMVFTRWGWSTAWINVSLVALLLMSALGPAINAKRFKALYHAAQGSPESPLSQGIITQMNDPVLWTSVLSMATTSFGIVYLMTVKPGLIGTLVAIVVAIILGIALGQVLRGSLPIVVAEKQVVRQEG